MSSTVTVKPAKEVRGIGLFAVIAGIVLILAGAGTWAVVASQLSAEKITVSDDAAFFAGRSVNGPLTAYAQAEVINKHALEASGGKTYAELDQEDPVRAVVMNASFLRASLFTSVLAFGVCALVIGLGVLFLFVGIALRRLSAGARADISGPPMFVSNTSSGRHAPSYSTPEPAPEPNVGMEPSPVATSAPPEPSPASAATPPPTPTAAEPVSPTAAQAPADSGVIPPVPVATEPAPETPSAVGLDPAAQEPLPPAVEPPATGVTQTRRERLHGTDENT